jgi:hypothetical protein
MSVGVTRQMFGSANTIDTRLNVIVVRPALWRSKPPREKLYQGRTSLEVVGHVHPRLHARNVGRILHFDED